MSIIKMTIYYSDKPYDNRYYQYIDPHGRNVINPIIKNVQNIQQNLNEPADTATFDGNIIVDGKNKTLPYWVDNIADKPILKIKKGIYSRDELRKNINFGHIIYVFIRLLSDGDYQYFYQNTLKVTNVVVDKQVIQDFVSNNPYLQEIIIPNIIKYQDIEFDNFIPVEYNENITFMRTRLEIKENKGRLYNLGFLESYIEEIESKNPHLQEIILPNRLDYQDIEFNNFNQFINGSFIYYSKNI